MANIRIVHTSDVHLGKRFPHLSREGEILRSQDLMRVFSDIVDHAVKIDASLFIIAGDLFDNINVSRETIAAVLTCFGRFNQKRPGSHIVMTPGETELLRRGPDSSDSLLHIFAHLPYVHLLGAENIDTLRLTIDKSDVVVTSAPLDTMLSPEFKSRDIPTVKDAFGVFLLHAYSRRHVFDPEDKAAWDEFIFSPLSTRGYSYLALGHRHSLHQIKGDITAVFPGAPERLNIEADRDKKFFMTVEAGDGPMRMKAVATRVRPVEFMAITCAPGEDKVTPVLNSLSTGSHDRILYIVLEGQMDYETFTSLRHSEILAELQKKFALVHIDNRLVLVDPANGYDYSALRVETPAEEFRRHVEREINASSGNPDELRLLQELLLAGLAEIEEGP